MMRLPGRAGSLLLSIVVTCVMAGTGVGRAQQPPGPPRPGGTSAQQAAPPVIQFAAGGIPLEEAVRLTLQSDPAIRLAEADVALKKGIGRNKPDCSIRHCPETQLSHIRSRS